MNRWLPVLIGCLLLGSPARAQISIATDNIPVTETFDAFRGTGFAPSPSVTQLDSDDFVAQGFSEGSLDFGDTGASGDFARGDATGGVGTGGVYAFETSSGDFSLGVQPTGTDFAPGGFVVRYENNTGGLIDDLNVAYEIKVYNDQDRSNSLNLSHATSSACATDPATLSFTDISAADYTSPEAADATPAWQTVLRGIYISGLSVGAMHCFYLRFEGDDVGGSGSRDQYALDDLAVTANPDVPLPVELVAFTALVDGNTVLLRWATASETNNAGFEIQKNSSIKDWKALDFVEGRGTTLEAQSYQYRVEGLLPGTHRFRLKQIDYDGAFAYSPEVEVAVSVPGVFHLSAAYPNPFSAATQFSLSVARLQRVAVAVYDLRGRRVALVYDGLMPAQTTRPFTFVTEGLPGGVYLIHVQGERFAASRAVTLVR